LALQDSFWRVLRQKQVNDNEQGLPDGKQETEAVNRQTTQAYRNS
jgi:hypothetical protein